MKTLKTISTLFFLLFFFETVGFGQDIEIQTLKAADEAMNEGDYYTASVFYGRLVNDVPARKLEHVEKYAQALYLYHSYNDAANWFEYLYKNDTLKKYPEALFWWALMTKQTAKYAEALELFKKSEIEYKGDNQYLKDKTKVEIKACVESIRSMSEPLDLKIEHLSKTINSPYSEFNAIQLGDTALYFSSLRLVVAESANSIFPSVFVSKIYRSTMSIAGYSEGKELPQAINNPETHNANFCFSPDKSRLYFTRCKNERKPQLNCEIWVSEISNDKWKKPERLSRRINAPGVTTTHPFITTYNEGEVLYFTTDRAGGYGGMDVWYSIYNNGKYYDPVNLGSNINTQGNEITPFYDSKTTTLYFSSDWHPGLGGYDVFSSKGGLNQWGSVINVGYPINSPANDLYFNVIEEDADAGYFTSNRQGSYFINGETCCNDIYYYEWKEKPKQIALIDTLFIENHDISLKIKDLLPLTLYFHNDEPDPATTKTTTTKNYKTTLADYFALKEIYRQEYSQGLEGNDKIKAQQDIEVFFNDYIKKGFTDLELFAEWLKKDLDRGNNVKITIRGYTSPLHTAEYNMKLASRRISSLKNYLYEYNNGVFMPYIRGEVKNSLLEILDAPIGKTEASPLVSDNPNDKRNSIYSRAAALERRIQIVMYESEKAKTPSDSLPEIKLSQYDIDFGTVNLNHNNVLVVQFLNIGGSDLIISEIVSDNSALEVVYMNSSVSKNQKGDFTLKLHPKLIDKEINATITIKSNSYKGTVVFRVKAKVG